MMLTTSNQCVAPRPLLGRDVYELPFLSEQGRPLFVLIDQDSRLVGPVRELLPGESRTAFIQEMDAELDAKRPIWTPTIV